MATINTGLSADNNVVRGSGYSEYPPIWNFEYIQSIKSEYAQGEGAYVRQRDKLKDRVSKMLNEKMDPLFQLENIDILQRLGLYYHFEGEIKSLLDGIYSTNDFESGIWKDNLYATAVKFRLLRQHQYSVPQEIFNVFLDESGKFKGCLGNDVKGLLSLYETSLLLMHGEKLLEEAREFASKHLQEFVKQNQDESYLHVLVNHALENPLHWRVPSLEVRWFIDLYRRSHEILNPTFLELSILDYNIVQAIHQEELKELSRWWRDLKLTEKMKFFRDRLVENTLWNTTMIFEPQHAYCRKMLSKLFNFLAILDDIYDSYGKIDELELFTTAIGSWDLKAMDQLPDYMKITFFVVYNFTNEIAFNVLKEQGLHILKYLKKIWEDYLKALLQEARWSHNGTTPTLHQYMENARVSISVPTLASFVFFCVENPITEDALKLFHDAYPSVIRQASLICRLTNDLGTDTFEKKKGDVPTSIECYMHETGVSEDAARHHILSLVNDAWKQLNEDRATKSALSRTFTESITNFTRMTMWMYDGRDAYGVHNHCLKDSALSLFVNPISLGD